MRALVLLLAFIATTALADSQIYKWKDAQGTTHYSDSPPSGAYQAETIKLDKGTARVSSEGEPTSKPAVDAASEKPVDSVAQACEQARKNVELLASGITVRMDLRGDGTQVEIKGDERARQLERAKAQVTLLCSK